MGLMLVLVFGGLRLGARAWEAGQARFDSAAEMQAVQSFVRRALTQAYPAVTDDEVEDGRVIFTGAADAVDFVAPLPTHLGLGGFYRISFGLDEAQGETRLVMSQRLYQAGTLDPARVAETTVILENVASVLFGYFGAPRDGDDPAWHDRWSAAGSLPELVRMRVRFPEGDGRRWADLVVAPMVHIEAGCLYDRASKRCRGR